jgi:hypothetical protein
MKTLVVGQEKEGEIFSGLEVIFRSKMENDEVERGLRESHGGSDLTKVQYKPIWSCHSESPLYNEYILMENGK